MSLESYFCYIYKNAELQTRKKVMCLDFMNNRRTVSPVLCCCTVIASANNLLIYFSPYWKKLIKKRGGGFTAVSVVEIIYISDTVSLVQGLVQVSSMQTISWLIPEITNVIGHALQGGDGMFLASGKTFCCCCVFSRLSKTSAYSHR